MSRINMTDYNRLRNQTYKKYKQIKSIRCPYLKTDVVFNSQGFWHMIYTGRNEKRDKKNQILRFQLLSKAVRLLSITTTLQEFEKRKDINTIYYGFIAIIKNCKIKVVVRKVGNGAYTFWSVIPNWVTNAKRDKRFSKGDLQKD